MAANLDFCRKCEASYTSSEGDMGMCGTCNEQSEAIAEQLREAYDLLDELNELDAQQSDAFYAEYNCLDDGRFDSDGRFDCDGNPPDMDNHCAVG